MLMEAKQAGVLTLSKEGLPINSPEKKYSLEGAKKIKLEKTDKPVMNGE